MWVPLEQICPKCPRKQLLQEISQDAESNALKHEQSEEEWCRRDQEHCQYPQAVEDLLK